MTVERLADALPSEIEPPPGGKFGPNLNVR